MSRRSWGRWTGKVLLSAAALHGGRLPALPPEQASATRPVQATPPAATPDLSPTAPASADRVLPVNLPTALKLAGARSIDVALASRRIGLAAAQLERAEVAWLPSVYLGTDYSRHDGQIQDVAGNVVGASKSSFMVGAGPSAVFSLSDAFLGPLAARQDLRARQAALQTAQNDSTETVAVAYFNVQQARGQLAAAEDVARRLEQLVRRTRDLVTAGVVPELEVVRARTATAVNRQAVETAREHWRVAGADLIEVLRLDPSTVVEPLEPPQLQVTLVGQDRPVDELIGVGLTNRPELASGQALVQATLERLRQEKLRPLIPSVLLRGYSTPVTGTLAGGLFGGGVNGDLSNFGARSDFDLQVLWEVENLGFGNRARVRQRRAENEVAVLELFRVQDRVAAEVARAYAQAQSAAARIDEARGELRDAADSAGKNLQGLGQTKTAANVLILVVRPQEVVAAIQALGQAYDDYYAAVADYNRAQFRLYHALGQPAQALTDEGAACPIRTEDAAATGLPAPASSPSAPPPPESQPRSRPQISFQESEE